MCGIEVYVREGGIWKDTLSGVERECRKERGRNGGDGVWW